MTPSRLRPAASLALLAAAALALGGCADAPAPAPPAAAAGGAGFPVTIEHERGETVIPAAPARVVSLSVTGNAYAQAADAPLVGYWPSALGEAGRDPWLAPFAADAEPVSFSADFELDYEQIAALQPDLIIASDTQTRIALDDAYETLSAIAPTLPALPGDSAQQALATGRALGNEAGVQQLLDEADAAIAAAVAAHPGIAGTALGYGQISPNEIGIQVDAELASSVRFFESLGFVMPPAILADYDRATARTPGTARYSWENADALDAAELLIVGLNGVEPTEVTANPLFTATAPFRDNRVELIPIELLYALQLSGPYNTGWVLGELEPALARIPAPGE